MKKFLLLFILIATTFTFAHTPLLSVSEVENEKGLIKIKGGFDNGESATGETIYLLSDLAYDGNEAVYEEEGGENYFGKFIIYEGELNSKEELVLPKPAMKRYLVLFSGGIGHVVSAKGIALRNDEIDNWTKLLEDYSSSLGKYKEKFKIKNFK